MDLYNRYIPQADGSYTRNRMQDGPQRHTQPSHPRQRPQPEKEHIRPPEQEPVRPPRDNPPHHRQWDSGSGFLRQLLPAEFDTGDLIVVLLLLLMAGDCPEERNNAILTIALYFLM